MTPPALCAPALDDPQLRPSNWLLKSRRPFIGNHRQSRAEVYEDLRWSGRASRRAAAFVSSRHQSTHLAGFARLCTSDLALQRFVKARSYELKLGDRSAGCAFARQLRDCALSKFNQISRHHETHPFAPFMNEATVNDSCGREREAA